MIKNVVLSVMGTLIWISVMPQIEILVVKIRLVRA